MPTWWLQVREPDGSVHLWNLGEHDETHDFTGEVEAVQARHEVPPGWFDDLSAGWECSLSSGQPHRDLLAVATVHDYADLAIPSATLDAFRDGHAAWQRRRRVDTALAALAALDPDERADVLAASRQER